MAEEASLEQLTHEVRQIYESDPLRAEALVEAHLQGRMRGLSAHEKLTRLEALAAEFSTPAPGPFGKKEEDEEVLSKVCALLLGRRVAQADLPSAELLQRLATSLNTIFDTLNELVGVINATLIGRETGDETIRQVIGHHLAGEGESNPLESYLAQIKEAFLTAQRAFKKAAHSEVSQILVELDPERISKEGGRGLKFGPLRKAESFDMYEEKFGRCKRWFESGRFMEEFLREFEKNAQELSAR